LQRYRYFPDGNLSSSELYGNLTGKSAPVFLNQSLSSPTGLCDVYQEHYTYDDKKRRKTEKDGRTTQEYHYLNDSDFVTAHYTTYQGRIRIRRFYTYDANGAVTSEIIDDGSDKAVENLTHVSERLIKKMKNTSLGLPDTIKEYALDLETGKPQFIRKTMNLYTSQGWLSHQSHL
jgi:hypothetical protein